MPTDSDDRTVVEQRAWEFLLRRYDVERADDRNERAVFAGLIASLIAVVALTAVLVREGGDDLSKWVYAAAPAAPLAMLALIALVMQVASVRALDLKRLETELETRTDGLVPNRPARGFLQRWMTRAMFFVAVGLWVLAVVVLCVIALARTDCPALQWTFGSIYAATFLVEVWVFLDSQRRRHRLQR